MFSRLPNGFHIEISAATTGDGYSDFQILEGPTIRKFSREIPDRLDPRLILGVSEGILCQKIETLRSLICIRPVVLTFRNDIESAIKKTKAIIRILDQAFECDSLSNDALVISIWSLYEQLNRNFQAEVKHFLTSVKDPGGHVLPAIFVPRKMSELGDLVSEFSTCPGMKVFTFAKEATSGV